MEPIRTLLPFQYAGYRDHLLRLESEGRRLRFGGPIGDDGISTFIDNLRLRETRVLAAFDPALRVIGAAHIALGNDGTAEAAFSVDEEQRGRGLGRALLARAVLWARNRGIRTLHVHFLSENSAMRGLARAAGMRIATEAGECQAALTLPPATPLSLWQEAAGETVGLLSCCLWRVAHVSQPGIASPRPA
jgi:GNAT superfamily N-acetyltransferase